LCLHFVLQAIKHLFATLSNSLQKSKIPSLLRSILCIPQKSPLILLECVICVFEIGVSLVLVFVGFGLFQICLCFSFSPYSKDHALHRYRVSSDSSPSACSHSGSPFLEFHSAMPSPSPMAQDLPPSNEERISHLEATIDDLRSQGDITKTMLQSILDKLGALAFYILAPSPVFPRSQIELITPLSPISPFTPPSTSQKKPVLKASPLLSSTVTAPKKKPSLCHAEPTCGCAPRLFWMT